MSAPPQSAYAPLPALQNDGGAREFLLSQHWPEPLQETFITNITKTPLRYFICDDSGSMGTLDGERLVADSGSWRLEKCTRIREMADMIKFHVELAKAAKCPSEFRLLNQLQPLKVGFNPLSENDEGITDFLSACSRASGGTPLCRHLREITADIRVHADQLRATNQRACVIIITDGEASDGNISDALRPLKDLPVWVTVRLCTNDDSIESYWDRVDKDLELNMDVLDDHLGEAREIFKFNPFLTYGQPIHRMREFGVTIKEFDTIDERTFTKAELVNIAVMIYGDVVRSFPDPQTDLNGFLSKLEAEGEAHKGNTIPQAYNPISKKVKPWISTKKTIRKYNGSACTIV